MNVHIELLSDEDLLFLAKENIPLFLEAIKSNDKSYMRYSAQLGNKKKDSPLVKNNLPRIAVTLYRKSDKNFVKAMELLAEANASKFVEIANETLESNLSQEELLLFSDEQIADMVMKFRDSGKKENGFNVSLFGIQMKLLGFENPELRTENIVKRIGLENKNTDEEVVKKTLPLEEKEVEVEIIPKTQSSVKRVKNKKLSPEEKAAKTKAAITAKEKAKQEELSEQETSISDSISETENSVEESVTIVKN